MITPDYCRMMVRYNAWQNNSLLKAADTLDDQQRWQDRGAFFGSIAATLNHIHWGDVLWLERLAGNPRPEAYLSPSLVNPSDWAEFKDLRRRCDDALAQWATTLDKAAMAGPLIWYPASSSKRVEKPRALCIVGLFNHQTHHRGQVHCMLTAAGAAPEATDLILLE
ncbi:DinB family protein [Roseobacter sp. YSTF-M11]|uniref:DinB family protein n=1 Tax=Roseobacter insulae TaxID=2859783 RepID=A0A9X1FSF5_9RHOB|nr:DinB family protein [Roseobacter insulae]MBW4706637.1 DinB family protein [Roseobacter insulae]